MGPKQICTRVARNLGTTALHTSSALKRDNWEGGHRVPFIARWPGVIAASSRCNTPICFVDMMATFAEVLRVVLPPDQGVDSVSILPLLRGQDGQYRSEHGIIHHSSSGQFGIQKGDWKLLLHAGSGGNVYRTGKSGGRYAGTIEQKSYATSERQLYNLRDDPDETSNLVAGRPDIVEQLTALAAEYVTNGRSTSGPRQPYISENWPQLEWLPTK